MPGTNALVLVGLIVYLVASLLLWRLMFREPPSRGPRRGRPRWPVRLAKAVATLSGGAAAGAASLLVVATVVDAGRPGTMSTQAMLAIWAVGSVIAMLFIGRAPLLRRVVTRTCLALGVQGVILPLVTLISFVVAGSRLAGSAGTVGERTVEVLGVRLVGSLPAVGIGLAGFCVGLVLVIVGDRARRRVAKRRDRRRFRSSRAGVISVRARR
ncbi:MAG TPA: hypothetical protein VLK28_05800 [Methylomirabilota bacterium]|nr:hypothetical protein [Methylomirabilota bacterium]